MDDTSFIGYSREVIDYLASAPPLQDWPECRQILLDMLAAEESWIIALPVLSCEAVGGKCAEAISVAASWTALRHAANLIDKVQDGDFVQSSQINTPEIAISYAIALIFSAFQFLDDSVINSRARRKILSIYAGSGFDSSMGQFQDLNFVSKQSKNTGQLEEYWNVVILKSGSIFKAGTAGGAAAGSASKPLIEALGDYGTALGVIRQVLDDCRDVWIDSETSKGNATLPLLLHALIHDSGSQNRKNAGEHTKLSAGRAKIDADILLHETHIPEIIASVLLEWRRRALESLQILEPSEARSALVGILEHVLSPRPPDP